MFGSSMAGRPAGPLRIVDPDEARDTEGAGAIAVRSAAAPGGRQTSAPNRSRRGIRPISAKGGCPYVVCQAAVGSCAAGCGS